MSEKGYTYERVGGILADRLRFGVQEGHRRLALCNYEDDARRIVAALNAADRLEQAKTLLDQLECLIEAHVEGGYESMTDNARRLRDILYPRDEEPDSAAAGKETPS